MPTILAPHLTDFAAALLATAGVGTDEASRVAHSLVGANLRGHDSHGVMRVPYYCDGVRRGDVRPGVELVVERETACTVVADGQWGFGQTQAQRLLDRLLPMAQSAGLALGTLKHSGHIGRLGEYCERAAEAGLITQVMVNTHGVARRVAPVGGMAPRLGTNPLAIGLPTPRGPIILDFGTSATAEGKVRILKLAGQPAPAGWLLDSLGQPSTDPRVLYEDPPGSILPLGGDQAYKGFGLALAIELLTGALSGGVCARERPENPLGNCVFLQVIDPAALGGAGHFAREAEALVDFVRGCPRAAGVDAIVLPGDPERRTLEQRTVEGIPLDDGNWQPLVDLAARGEVRLPPFVPRP